MPSWAPNGKGSLVEKCVITGNASPAGGMVGLRAGAGSRIIGNIVENNTCDSMPTIVVNVDEDCEIRDNIIRGNGSNLEVCTALIGGPHCAIRNNTVTANFSQEGNLFGIWAQAGSVVEGNVVSNNKLGGAAGKTLYGIRAEESTISNNTVFGNAADASGTLVNVVGIYAQDGDVVRGNHFRNNTGAGVGSHSRDIEVVNNCRVEGNSCSNNNAGPEAWGIYVGGNGNIIASNDTRGHAGGGLLFTSAYANRAIANQMHESVGIDTDHGVDPSDLGTGDLANVVY